MYGGPRSATTSISRFTQKPCEGVLTGQAVCDGTWSCVLTTWLRNLRTDWSLGQFCEAHFIGSLGTPSNHLKSQHEMFSICLEEKEGNSIFFLVYVRYCVNTYSAWITTDPSFTSYLYYSSLGKLSTWRIVRITRDLHSRHLHHSWFDWIKILKNTAIDFYHLIFASIRNRKLLMQLSHFHAYFKPFSILTKSYINNRHFVLFIQNNNNKKETMLICILNAVHTIVCDCDWQCFIFDNIWLTINPRHFTFVYFEVVGTSNNVLI